MHPIVIRHDGVLVAGERRLAACKSLGWQKVPVTIINIEEIVHGEFGRQTGRDEASEQGHSSPIERWPPARQTRGGRKCAVRHRPTPIAPVVIL